jgi:hypothetical protein
VEAARARWRVRGREDVARAGGLEGLEAALQECGGRPHWGKRHAAGEAYLAAVHPGWAAFRAAAGPGARIP